MENYFSILGFQHFKFLFLYEQILNQIQIFGIFALAKIHMYGNRLSLNVRLLWIYNNVVGAIFICDRAYENRPCERKLH